MAGLEQRQTRRRRGPALWRAASSRPGSRSGRITLWSSLSGLASASAGSSARRSRSSAAGEVKLQPTTSCMPAVAQRVLQPAAQPLRRSQAPHRARTRGQGGGQPVEAIDAGDLLDQVCLALHVGVAPVAAPSPSAPRPGSVAKPSESRIAPTSSRGITCPSRRSIRSRRRFTTRGSSGRRVRVDRAGRHPRAAQLHHQPGRQALRGDRAARGAAASRSASKPRCAGPAPWTSAGCSDPPMSPPPSAPAWSCRRPRRSGRPSRRRSPTAPSASHTRAMSASSSRSTSSSVTIFSPRSALPHHDPPAAHLVEVEGVQRLAGAEHHVVGDVDDVGDRPLAGGRQALLEPLAATGRSSRPRTRGR